MKIKIVLFISLSAIFLISGCSSNSTKETEESAKKDYDLSSVKESTEIETIASTDGSINDSSIDDVRKENPINTVSQLRRQLYEAGINSSSISDSELEQYKKEADEKGIEFTKYVSDIVQ